MSLREVGTAALHLFTLSGFAIAQPLMDVLGRHPEFLVAHEAGRTEIVGVALGLLFGPAAIGSLLVLAMSRLSPRSARAMTTCLMGLLLGLTLMPVMLREEAIGDVATMLLALLAAVGGGALYSRFMPVRRFVSIAAFAPVLLAGLFLANEDVQKMLAPNSIEAVSIGAVTAGKGTPVVVVVFDELPLSSLLAAPSEIDSRRYPNFAMLARESTWFRGASAVSTMSSIAIPSILTGRYPGPKQLLPIQADYPNNLFSWLASRYRLHVTESDTLIHASTDRPAEVTQTKRASLWPDIGTVYLHLISPSSIRQLLPPITNTWAHFSARDGGGSQDRFEQDAQREMHRRERDVDVARFETEAFRRFVATIGAMHSDETAPRNQLHFLHVMYPHNPWRVLPSGKRYLPTRAYGLKAQRWMTKPWWSTDAYRRHLLQVGHADRLLGDLMARLRELRLWEEAIIVVTSDHGASFWPSAPFRGLAGNTRPEDLLSVPLFIRSPDHHEGRVDRRIAESIDIMPTIADLLDLDVPWSMDGCSLFGSADRKICGRSDSRRLVVPNQVRVNEVFSFEQEVVWRNDTLERKLKLFGSGKEENGLYIAGQSPELIGRAIDTLPVLAGSGGVVRLDRQLRRILKRTPVGTVPARIVGVLELRERSDHPRVAVAIDGRIEVVVPAPLDEENIRRVSAMLPPAAAERVPEGLSLYLVSGKDQELSLMPLAAK